MRKLFGYMLTWTTYGTWLQGDERGYVKDGETLGENPALEAHNLNNLTSAIVKLNIQQQFIVKSAIEQQAINSGQKILALSVDDCHVHLLVESSAEQIHAVVGRYKNAARKALQANGFVGRVWTTGYDKRFCYDKLSMQNRVEYVNAHNKKF